MYFGNKNSICLIIYKNTNNKMKMLQSMIGIINWIIVKNKLCKLNKILF